MSDILTKIEAEISAAQRKLDLAIHILANAHEAKNGPRLCSNSKPRGDQTIRELSESDDVAFKLVLLSHNFPAYWSSGALQQWPDGTLHGDIAYLIEEASHRGIIRNVSWTREDLPSRYSHFVRQRLVRNFDNWLTKMRDRTMAERDYRFIEEMDLTEVGFSEAISRIGSYLAETS